jgi:hypothetical protein
MPKQIDIKPDGTPVVSGLVSAPFTLASSDDAGKVKIDPATGVMSVNDVAQKSVLDSRWDLLRWRRIAGYPWGSQVWVPLVTVNNPGPLGSGLEFGFEFIGGGHSSPAMFNSGKLLCRLRSDGSSVSQAIKLHTDFPLGGNSLTFGYVSTGTAAGSGTLTLYVSCLSFLFMSYKNLDTSAYITLEGNITGVTSLPSGYAEITPT